MNHPGEIRTLVGIAEPEVRVWTNVGDAHLGFFESADAIADAKAEILENGAALARAGRQCERRPRHGAGARGSPARVMTFGIDVDADVRASSVVHRGRRGNGSARVGGRTRSPPANPLLGLGNLSNVLAAMAVGLHFDVPLDDMVARAGHAGAGISPRRSAAAARRASR